MFLSMSFTFFIAKTERNFQSRETVDSREFPCDSWCARMWFLYSIPTVQVTSDLSSCLKNQWEMLFQGHTHPNYTQGCWVEFNTKLFFFLNVQFALFPLSCMKKYKQVNWGNVLNNKTASSSKGWRKGMCRVMFSFNRKRCHRFKDIQHFARCWQEINQNTFNIWQVWPSQITTVWITMAMLLPAGHRTLNTK